MTVDKRGGEWDNRKRTERERMAKKQRAEEERKRRDEAEWERAYAEMDRMAREETEKESKVETEKPEKPEKPEKKAESVEKKEVKKSKAKKSKAKKSQAAKEVPSEGLQPEREVRATQSGSEVKTVVKSNNGSLTTAYIAVAVLMVIVAVLYAIYMKSYSQ